VLANPPHFLHTVCVVRCTVHNNEGHRRCRIFVMQRRRACIGGHGTGGGGTCPPPLGTTTHRYIFPYCLFGLCTDIHAIWVLVVVLCHVRCSERVYCVVGVIKLSGWVHRTRSTILYNIYSGAVGVRSLNWPSYRSKRIDELYQMEVVQFLVKPSFVV